MEAGSCFIKSTPTFTNKTPHFLYVIAQFEERMVKIVSDIFMSWHCFSGCLCVGDGEISPRRAVDGAVTSRATKPQQLEMGLYYFFMLAEKTVKIRLFLPTFYLGNLRNIKSCFQWSQRVSEM